MERAFSECCNLEYINIINLNTANVTSFSNLFRNCKSLKSLNLSNFDTSNAVDMVSMFRGCSILTSLNYLLLIQRMLFI